ncbi:MAG: YbaN family protein [Polyangiaceae bacterium]
MSESIDSTRAVVQVGPAAAPGTAPRSAPSAAAAFTAQDARWSGRRLLYFAAGWLFFVLGVLGAVLPLLPTTPFMLLAAWAFSNSSQRFERWLLEHRWFGEGIKRWRAHRVVPARVKRVSYLTMLATFTFSVASGRVAWWALLAQAALMGYGAWFLWRLPSEPPEEVGESRV